MTPRERLLTAIRNQKPDHVPAAPDLYEMIPVRLSGRPSWEMLVYEDPPIWKGRVDACLHYGVDAFIPLGIPAADAPPVAVVVREDDRIVTRQFTETAEGRVWSPIAIVYYRNEPSAVVKAETIGLPAAHEDFEVVKSAYGKTGKAYLHEAMDYLGDRGVIAPFIFLPALAHWPEEQIQYMEDPEPVRARMESIGEQMVQALDTLLSWEPDVVCIGCSGMMIFNPPPIFRDLTLRWLQKLTRMAKDRGVPTHLHCCGPERSLVEMAALETDLSCIEPLEPPPMGDCDLAEIKAKFGDRIAFKGNLHTTKVMLMGTVTEVEDACKRAIDDAGAGGGFILSTGDQTPRDTPDENILAMQRVAETYGRY